MPAPYALRSITFSADLLYKPVNHDPKNLQRVHSLLFADPVANYVNFSAIPGGAQLSNPQNSSQVISTALFLPDRVRIQEHHTGISQEDFASRLVRVAEHCLKDLEIPAIIAQQVVVQSLVNPRQTQDTREFIARHMWHLSQDDFTPLARMPQLIGMRLAFPQSQEHPGIFNVRVESYGLDSRSLFLENVGVFGAPITAEGLSAITTNVGATYGFLEQSVMPFVVRFDGIT
jgi:hypothetical protein